MAFLSLVAVLLLEQLWPLPYHQMVYAPLAAIARGVESRLNGGEVSHGLIAWLATVGVLVLVAGGVGAALYAVNPLLAWLWNVALLYLTMGFRQFSHYYTDIQLALRLDDLAHARKLIGEWRGEVVDDLSAAQIARLAIEQALRASHRHVFGVLACFVLLPGPCGAVLYRVAAFLAEQWGARADDDLQPFGRFARQAFALLDWLPQRLTAAGFAVVGNFEGAVYCWRTQASEWTDCRLDCGVVLASGAGALGVDLRQPAAAPVESDERGEMNCGDEAGADFMQSAVGLVWRALLLWLLLLLLLELAQLIGS